MKFSQTFLAIGALLLILCGCSQDKTDNYQTFADLEGKRIAVKSGTVFDQMVLGVVKNPDIHYLTTSADLFQALEARNVDAIGLDLSIAKPYLKLYPQTRTLSELINHDAYGIAFPKNSPYKAGIDSVIQTLRESGELQQIIEKWENETEDTKSEDPVNSDLDEVLRVAVEGSNPPFDFFKNNKLAGINIDIINAIGAALHKKMEISIMDFAGFMPSLGANKTDMCMSSISITEERKKIIDFSIPYYYNENVIIVLDKSKENKFQQYTTFKGLEGKKIAVATGSIYDKLTSERIKAAEIKYFTTYTDIFNALKSRKVDAISIDKSVVYHWMRNFPDVKILDEKLSKDYFGIAIKKGNPIKATIDSLIQILKDNGELAQIIDKWNHEKEDDYCIPQDWEGKNGTLNIATEGINPPFDFFKGNQLAGINIDLMLRLGKMLDKKIVFKTYEFSTLIPSITSGKVDLGISGISITEERQKLVDFSIPYYENEGIVVVRDESALSEMKTSFIAELKKSFHRTFLQENRWKMVCNGLGITIIISIFSGIFGTLLGFIICFFRRSKNRVSSITSAVFIRVIQGMPVLVLLMILYYIIFGHSNLNGVVVAVIGFGINFGVYASEIMRSGMDAVEKGQLEAAAALGYNRRQTFFKILLPQAANHFIPVLKGEFISMVKMTSIVGYIAVMDLTKVTDIIRSRTMEAFFPLIATAILYFIIANILTYILTLVEKKTDPKHRERKVKGVN
ncbi:MAG: ABC transporter permease subunit [Fibrobacter sp.]|nr:ABC transporter permease subunit [Fibrobacter sp.]